MIQKIYNPGASTTNSVVVINNTACCGGTCVECQYIVTGILIEGAEYFLFTFKNSVGKSIDINIDYTLDVEILRNQLIDFLQSIGYYVENPLTDISISFADVYYITIIFYGCADFLNFYTTVSGDQPAEKFCNFIPTCDYYFESDGNGGDPVLVSENGNDGTVHKFDILTDGAEDVIEFLAVFFTTSTITVIKNETAGYFEITLTGAPGDLLFIDGVQGIKQKCYKVYIA